MASEKEGHVFLPGLEQASPEVQELIQHKARWKRWQMPGPAVVRAGDFMAYDEASRTLQRRGAPWPSYKHAIADGLVRVVYRATDGEEGVSRASVEQEMGWRSTASIGSRLRRRLRLLAAPVLGPWRYPVDP